MGKILNNVLKILIIQKYRLVTKSHLAGCPILHEMNSKHTPHQLLTSIDPLQRIFVVLPVLRTQWRYLQRTPIGIWILVFYN